MEPNSVTENKIAVVTGAAGGIGWGITTRLSTAGFHVVILDVNQGALEKALNQFENEGAGITGYVCDVTREELVRESIGAVIRDFGRIDVLVNNARLQHVALIEDFDIDQFRRLVDVMLTGAFLMTKYVVPHMKSHKQGRIINISSINGLIGFAGKSAYNSAKHGLLGLTKVTALEVAEYDITVNAVCPGYVDTDLVRGQLKDLARTRKVSEDRVLDEVIFPLVPQKRLITIEEVAELVAFLTHDLARGITGQALVIDGGYTVR